jgi:hypothetical protein
VRFFGTLIVMAALLIATTILTAHAASRPQPKIVRTPVRGALYPPPQYDKPYEGELEIMYFSDAEYIERICNVGPKVYGCASPPRPDRKTCKLFVSSEALAKRQGRDFALMLRHELAHCNGWKHPESTNGRKFSPGEKWAEAEGAIFIPINTKKPMPKLPATTKILPASPPVVCVTPEWKPEPCKDRSVDAVVVGGDYGTKAAVRRLKPTLRHTESSQSNRCSRDCSRWGDRLAPSTAIKPNLAGGRPAQ